MSIRYENKAPIPDRHRQRRSFVGEEEELDLSIAVLPAFDVAGSSRARSNTKPLMPGITPILFANEVTCLCVCAVGTPVGSPTSKPNWSSRNWSSKISDVELLCYVSISSTLDRHVIVDFVRGAEMKTLIASNFVRAIRLLPSCGLAILTAVQITLAAVHFAAAANSYPLIYENTSRTFIGIATRTMRVRNLKI